MHFKGTERGLRVPAVRLVQGTWGSLPRRMNGERRRACVCRALVPPRWRGVMRTVGPPFRAKAAAFRCASHQRDDAEPPSGDGTAVGTGNNATLLRFSEPKTSGTAFRARCLLGEENSEESTWKYWSGVAAAMLLATTISLCPTDAIAVELTSRANPTYNTAYEIPRPVEKIEGWEFDMNADHPLAGYTVPPENDESEYPPGSAADQWDPLNPQETQLLDLAPVWSIRNYAQEEIEKTIGKTNGVWGGIEKTIRVRAVESIMEHALWGVFGPLVGLLVGTFIAGKVAEKRRKSATLFGLRSAAASMDSASFKEMMSTLGLPPWAAERDTERPGWANQVVETIWPYLDKATSDAIRINVDPILEYYRPAIFSSIKFDQFKFGDVPATIEGVKVYDTGDEGSIEADLFVVWAGNPDVILGVRAAGDTMRVQVAVTEFQVSGCVRLIFKPLLPYFPLFGAIEISLASKPEVDFDLRVIGSDITLVPGAAPALRSFLNNILKEYLVWPRRVVVPIAGESLKDPIRIEQDFPNAIPGTLYIRVVGSRGVMTTLSAKDEDAVFWVALGVKARSLPQMNVNESDNMDKVTLRELMPNAGLVRLRTDNATNGSRAKQMEAAVYSIEVKDWRTEAISAAVLMTNTRDGEDGNTAQWDASFPPARHHGEINLNELPPQTSNSSASWVSVTIDLKKTDAHPEANQSSEGGYREAAWNMLGSAANATIGFGSGAVRGVQQVPGLIPQIPGALLGFVSNFRRRGDSDKASGVAESSERSRDKNVRVSKAEEEQALRAAEVIGRKKAGRKEESAKDWSPMDAAAAAMVAADAAVAAAEKVASITGGRPQLRIEIRFEPRDKVVNIDAMFTKATREYYSSRDHMPDTWVPNSAKSSPPEMTALQPSSTFKLLPPPPKLLLPPPSPSHSVAESDITSNGIVDPRSSRRRRRHPASIRSVEASFTSTTNRHNSTTARGVSTANSSDSSTGFQRNGSATNRVAEINGPTNEAVIDVETSSPPSAPPAERNSPPSVPTTSPSPHKETSPTAPAPVAPPLKTTPQPPPRTIPMAHSENSWDESFADSCWPSVSSGSVDETEPSEPSEEMFTECLQQEMSQKNLRAQIEGFVGHSPPSLAGQQRAQNRAKVAQNGAKVTQNGVKVTQNGAKVTQSASKSRNMAATHQAEDGQRQTSSSEKKTAEGFVEGTSQSSERLKKPKGADTLTDWMPSDAAKDDKWQEGYREKLRSLKESMQFAAEDLETASEEELVVITAALERARTLLQNYEASMHKRKGGNGDK